MSFSLSYEQLFEAAEAEIKNVIYIKAGDIMQWRSIGPQKLFGSGFYFHCAGIQIYQTWSVLKLICSDLRK